MAGVVGKKGRRSVELGHGQKVWAEGVWRLCRGEERKEERGVRSGRVIWPLDGLLGHWEVHK